MATGSFPVSRWCLWTVRWRRNSPTAETSGRSSSDIFQGELQQLYQRKDISYKEVAASALSSASGKKVYGYLPKPVKEQVDNIVEELAKLPQVAECYEVEKDEDAAHQWFTRSAAQGNEYAQRFLDHWGEFHGPTPFQCATRLLYHMSRVFQENSVPPTNPAGIRIDSKRRKQLMEKRLAMGHKPDDHEEQGQRQI